MFSNRLKILWIICIPILILIVGLILFRHQPSPIAPMVPQGRTTKTTNSFSFDSTGDATNPPEPETNSPYQLSAETQDYPEQEDISNLTDKEFPEFTEEEFAQLFDESFEQTKNDQPINDENEIDVSHTSSSSNNGIEINGVWYTLSPGQTLEVSYYTEGTWNPRERTEEEKRRYGQLSEEINNAECGSEREKELIAELKRINAETMRPTLVHAMVIVTRTKPTGEGK